MRALVRIMLALTLTIGLSATAFAQDPAPRAVPRAEETAADVNYDFDDDFVTGEGDSPLGTLLLGRIRGQRVSLVRPRVHFVPELCRSIERI